jgi:hypothetical protein
MAFIYMLGKIYNRVRGFGKMLKELNTREYKMRQ